MDEWKKPPPGLVEKKKKLPRLAKFYLLFVLIEVIIFIIFSLSIIYFNLHIFSALILFIVIFSITGVIGMAIRFFILCDVIKR